MSAYEIPGLRFSIPAGAAIVQHRFVSVNANGQAIQATASTPVIGVSMNEVTATDELPAAKQIAEIADGIVIAEAGGTVAAGAAVASDASGKAITATDKAIAVAITAGVAGGLMSVKLI